MPRCRIGAANSNIRTVCSAHRFAMIIGGASRGTESLSMLRVGDTAPDFEAKTDGGGAIRLSDYRGQKVVLYFYPNDSTPLCTLEACSFRDAQSQFGAKKAVIFGVSGDSVESHDRFKARHGLPFPLVSDPDRSIAASYGVLRQRKLLGIGYRRIVRSTFVIDEDGRIDTVYKNVSVFGHAAQVLESLGQGVGTGDPVR